MIPQQVDEPFENEKFQQVNMMMTLKIYTG